jgi:NIPSNAP protein
MKITWFSLFVFAALSFAAGCLLTARFLAPEKVQAAGSRVFELRIYHTMPGKLPALVSRFGDHTRTIFDHHGMTSVGYWMPQDAPVKENTFIYILAHPNRDAATKNWDAFRKDPEWQKVQGESEKDGKLVDHVDSTFMTPTEFSKIQ